MDHPWRSRPPIQGNICPTCSVSHFPFCPPAHPQFNENPRFQPYNDYFPHRPRFESFVDHREPPAVNLHRPFGGDPGDVFVDRRAWPSSNPRFDMNPYDRSPGVDPAVMDGYYHNRHSFENGSYGSAGLKRMRVDEGVGEVYMNSVRFSGEVNVDSSRFSLESERILKLIREHGNALRGPPGVSLLTEPTREAPGVAEPPVRGAYEYKKFDELQEIRDERILKQRSNYEMGDIQNQGMDYFDRKESPFPARPVLNSHSYRGDHGSSFGNTYVQNDGDNQLGKSHFGRVENSIGHSLDNNRYNNLSAEHFTSMERSQQTSVDEVAHLYKGAVSYESISWSESEQSMPMSQRWHYQSSQMLHENHYNLQQFPPCEEPHQPHTGNNQLSPPCTVQNHFPPNRDFLAPRLPSDIKPSAGGNVTMRDDIQGSIPHRNLHGWSKLEEEGRCPPISFGKNVGPREISNQYNVQPPLPTSPPPPPPPPPLPMVPRSKAFPKPLPSSPPPNKPSLFPIAVSSSADVPPSHLPAPQAHSLIQTYYSNKHQHSSTSTSTEEFQASQLPMKKYLGESQIFPSRHLSLEKTNVVDARNIFKKPHRKSRPDHFVIILRGLPGSGKSYLAKMLRDLEVENGGEAPRIHSMDEYFMTEVEKAEEGEASKSSGSIRGKKPVMKKVMEYCFEPEMEDAYRSSMLKAFKKTLDEGVFSFIIVDDRNLRVADFAQFWATAKRSGFEVYLLEATYTDPAGCAARNVHNFTLNDIQKMADLWEEAPSLYLKLDIKSLLHGDDLEQSGIQEVDMDMEDGDPEDSSQGSHFTIAEDAIKVPMDDFGHHDVGPLKVAKKSVENHPTEEVKELRRSKWSDDWDDNDSRGAEDGKGNPSALSGLIQAYSKGGKSLCWADQAGNIGFSIGATTRTNVMSLIIGPGSGYNSKSNPLSEDEHPMSTSNSGVKSNGQSGFLERMRAERASFKAVFDKRRQRIHGFNTEEE